MEILGIGPLEIITVLLIAIIVLGPGDAVKTGRVIGKFLRNLVTSQWWVDLRRTTQELRKLPYTLMREANFEETARDVVEPIANRNNHNQPQRSNNPINYSSWITPNPSPVIPQDSTGERFSDREPNKTPENTRNILPW